MGIPNRQIGWDQQSNLLWQLQSQINKLGKTMSQCCGSSTSSGCITFTDITWEAFIAAIDAGTIADCYYNITNRPNSGTDPLYVLVEKGLPNFDNEVRRSEQATSALCITTNQGAGCFNVYAESETISFDYTEGAIVYPINSEKFCPTFSEGDVVTVTTIGSPSYTYTAIVHYYYNYAGKCEPVLEITGGTGPIPLLNDYDVNVSNGVDAPVKGTIKASAYNKECDPFPTLSVGDTINSMIFVPGIGTVFISATVTSISGTTVTIAPTTGDWNGVTVFWIGDSRTCLFVTTAPITTTSILLTPDPVCFDFNGFLGQGVYLNTLMQATDGLIYGTLSYVRDTKAEPGASGQLFSLDPVTEQVKILFNFNDYNTYGGNPNSGVVEIAGELYGTCNGGGSAPNPAGTIWKWNIATDTFTVLYSINYDNEGAYPYGTLLYTAGKLYGTCENGGNNDFGTLFEFDPIALTYTVLLNFGDNEDIRYPQGPLVEVIAGELWGTSYEGGTNNNGTVFKYTLSTGTDSIVVNLDDVSTGGWIGASGGVMLASDGNVYFNTDRGGDDNNGTICQITDILTTPSLSIVHSFDVDYGYGDAVCPVEISGNLYGCTNYTDNKPTDPCNPPVGNIYKFDISVGVFTTLHTFDALVDGGAPFLGQLLPLGDVLYGMTNEPKIGGQFCPINTQYGQIFKYNITTDTYTNIKALGYPVSTTAEIAESICASIVDPGYTCTTVGGCLFVSGTQFGNEAGQTLVVRTIVTFQGNLNDCNSPTPGQLLYNAITDELIGTVLSFSGSAPFTMEVELNDNANPGYSGFSVDVYIFGDGCKFKLDSESGTIIDYSVQPFQGGLEPVNRPCYYNATYDVITDYPLSQPHTKAQIDYLVSNNLLVPGAFYHIMDVDLFLYGGTEIVIQANSVHSFNDTAMGLFYNPRYDQSVEGFGIYDSSTLYSQGDTAIWGGLVITYNNTGFNSGNTSPYNLGYDEWTFPGKFKIFVDDTSNFVVGQIIYDPNGSDNSIVVTELGDNYIIVSCPPIFLAFATELWDDNSGTFLANIDSIELHESFYSDIIYNPVWDEITYDYANNFITSRKDNAGNYVEQTWNHYKNWQEDGPRWRSIVGFQWGNEYAYNSSYHDYVGMFSNKIVNSYVEVINFTLNVFYTNTFTNSSFWNNSFAIGRGYINNNTFINSYIYVNYFGNQTVMYDNHFESSYMSNCSFSSYIGVYRNNIEQSGISYKSGEVTFTQNIVNSSSLDLSTQTSGIDYTNFHGVSLNDNISAATIIYGNYSKDVVKNSLGNNYIKYIDNSGVQIVTTVTT